MLRYIEYNREERNLCAHLFRLLLEDQPNWGPLQEFLGVKSVTNPQIYCEVALIRDAYHVRKPDIQSYIEQLCQVLARQNSIDSYTEYASLPIEFRDCMKTNPKQLYYKLREAGLLKSKADTIVYGSLQAMFNAKPDLVICTGSELFVYEAKLSLDFDQEQLERTRKIAEVWSEVLYPDLGFDRPPQVNIRKLGLDRYNPDISWEKVYEMAKNHWNEGDLSVRVFFHIDTLAKLG